MKRPLQFPCRTGVALGFAFFAVVVAACWTLAAEESDLREERRSERQAMAGLPGVLVVLRMSESFKGAGITEELIRAKVELWLRTAGIEVLSDDDKDWPPRYPQLVVTLTGGESSVGDLFIFSMRVDLGQHVRTMVTNSPVMASTWNKSGAFFMDRGKLRQRLLDLLDGMVAEFANEFLAANPKAVKTK